MLGMRLAILVWSIDTFSLIFSERMQNKKKQSAMEKGQENLEEIDHFMTFCACDLFKYGTH